MIAVIIQIVCIAVGAGLLVWAQIQRYKDFQRELEQLDKNSNVIEPKFKIGQHVYAIDNDGFISLVKVIQIACLMNFEKMIITYYFDDGNFLPANQDEVFGSHEEAEKALAKPTPRGAA